MELKERIDGLLNEAYRAMNRHIFSGELPDMPVISSFENLDCGGYTEMKDGAPVKIHIAVLRLADPDGTPEDTLQKIYGAVLHEMVHVHNAVNGIADYIPATREHLPAFTEAAERYGLFYDEFVSEETGRVESCVNTPIWDADDVAQWIQADGGNT